MIISRTPFRVSFFGGGTDFPEYFREHGGAVLAAAIDKYCYLSVHSLGPFFKHRLRVSYARTETVIAIDHARDTVETKTIEGELLEPIPAIREEKSKGLVFGVVEESGVPRRMLSAVTAVTI